MGVGKRQLLLFVAKRKHSIALISADRLIREHVARSLATIKLPSRTETETEYTSGFVVHRAGIIATSLGAIGDHVTSPMDVRVDGRWFRATCARVHPQLSIALLAITDRKRQSFAPVRFPKRDGAPPSESQTVLAVSASPTEPHYRFAIGKVKCVDNRAVGMHKALGFACVQTDIDIDRSFSGGALLLASSAVCIGLCVADGQHNDNDDDDDEPNVGQPRPTTANFIASSSYVLQLLRSPHVLGRDHAAVAYS